MLKALLFLFIFIAGIGYITQLMGTAGTEIADYENQTPLSDIDVNETGLGMTTPSFWDLLTGIPGAISWFIGTVMSALTFRTGSQFFDTLIFAPMAIAIIYLILKLLRG